MNVGSPEYKPLRHVLNYVPVSYRREVDDPDQWVSWALQCLRTVNMHQRFVHDIELIEINKHKGYLPKGLKRITSIKMLYKTPSDEELSSLNSCVKYDNYKDALSDDDTTDCPSCNETTTETTTTEKILPGGATQSVTVEKSFSSNPDTCCSITYSLFLDSLYYKNCFAPMRYIGRTGKDYFTKSCYNSIHRQYSRNDYNEFSITEDGCLLTEAKSGFVCIEYTREAMSNNEFVAPAHPDQLWRGMAYYGMAQFWLNKTGFSGETLRNGMNMHREMLATSRNYMLEAKGIMKMSSIDLKTQLAITYNESRLLKMPSVWSFKIGEDARRTLISRSY